MSRCLFLVALVVLISPAARGQDASNPAQWRNWLFEIVNSIGEAHRTENADLFDRRSRRPIEFLASASQLPEERSIRVHCALAAQSAANFSLSLRQGKDASARADLREYRRYDKDCDRAIKSR